MKVQIIVEHKGNETTYTLKDEKRHPYIVLVTHMKSGLYEATGGHLAAHDEFVVAHTLHGKQFKTARGAENAALKFLTSHLDAGDVDVELIESVKPNAESTVHDNIFAEYHDASAMVGEPYYWVASVNQVREFSKKPKILSTFESDSIEDVLKWCDREMMRRTGTHAQWV